MQHAALTSAPTSASYAQAHDFLKRHAIRVTLTRILTMAVLMRTAQPLSVDAIYQLLHDAGERLSRASVYRAVTEFEGAGVVVQGWENIESGRMVYARAPAAALPATCDFTCTECARTIPVRDKLLAQQLYYHAVQGGFDQRLGDIALKIVCNDCNARQDPLP